MPSTSLKPRMLLSGVRSSWLIVARKSLLIWFISIEPHVGLGQFVDLLVEVDVHLAQFVLCRKSCRNMRLNAAPSSSNSSPV